MLEPVLFELREPDQPTVVPDRLGIGDPALTEELEGRADPGRRVWCVIQMPGTLKPDLAMT